MMLAPELEAAPPLWPVSVVKVPYPARTEYAVRNSLSL